MSQRRLSPSPLLNASVCPVHQRLLRGFPQQRFLARVVHERGVLPGQQLEQDAPEHVDLGRDEAVFEALRGKVSLRANDVVRELRAAVGRGDHARQLEAGHLGARIAD